VYVYVVQCDEGTARQKLRMRKAAGKWWLRRSADGNSSPQMTGSRQRMLAVK
jgi:hypothetical protein